MWISTQSVSLCVPLRQGTLDKATLTAAKLKIQLAAALRHGVEVERKLHQRDQKLRRLRLARRIERLWRAEAQGVVAARGHRADPAADEGDRGQAG
jgi:hypothetical protein